MIYKLTLLATLSLATCSQGNGKGNEKDKKRKKSDEPKITIGSSSIDYSKFTHNLKVCLPKFNPDNVGRVDVDFESVVNNDYPEGFYTVRILLSYELAVWADQGFISVNEGYATPEQHNLVMTVSELAKQLPDDLNSIERLRGIFEIITNSKRNEDLNPVGELMQ